MRKYASLIRPSDFSLPSTIRMCSAVRPPYKWVSGLTVSTPTVAEASSNRPPEVPRRLRDPPLLYASRATLSSIEELTSLPCTIIHTLLTFTLQCTGCRGLPAVNECYRVLLACSSLCQAFHFDFTDHTRCLISNGEAPLSRRGEARCEEPSSETMMAWSLH